jgi:hypothetical protein
MGQLDSACTAGAPPSGEHDRRRHRAARQLHPQPLVQAPHALGVAVQAACESRSKSKGLKPGDHVSRSSRVESPPNPGVCFKRYGSTAFDLYSPTSALIASRSISTNAIPCCFPPPPSPQRYKLNLKAQTLKPAFHLMGSRVETRRFQARWVNCIQPVQPHLAAASLFPLLVPFFTFFIRLHHQHLGANEREGDGRGDRRGAAYKVAFENKQIMKPGYHISG